MNKQLYNLFKKLAIIAIGVTVAFFGSFLVSAYLDSMRPLARPFELDFLMFAGIGSLASTLILYIYARALGKLFSKTPVKLPSVIFSMLVGYLPNIIVVAQVRLAECNPDGSSREWQCNYELLGFVWWSAFGAVIATLVYSTYFFRKMRRAQKTGKGQK